MKIQISSFLEQEASWSLLLSRATDDFLDDGKAHMGVLIPADLVKITIIIL